MKDTTFPKIGFVRLSQILGPTGPIPVSRSLFLQKVRDKEWPQPVRISARVTCWRAQDILDLVDRLPGEITSRSMTDSAPRPCLADGSCPSGSPPNRYRLVSKIERGEV
ncbi:AlpA family phage regulatory protein [Rhizobium sp. BK060]|uniref:AlpA family phage regulatory protein n=1 Tax=Rhizobium sp. BK060 TaxID=2587096 RepID=UPI00161DD059